MDELKIQLTDTWMMPTRAHATDAGLDLYAAASIYVPGGSATGGIATVPLGVKVQIPDGHVGLLLPRSSLLSVKGIVGMTGVIDAGYRGELKGVVHAAGDRPVSISAGDRLFQLVILPIATPTPVAVEQLEESPRGDAGFGSTGPAYLDDIYRKAQR